MIEQSVMSTCNVMCNVFRYVGTEVRNIYNNNVNATLRIWLDNVRCNGSERHIADCPHSPWELHVCGHNEDVAVSCYRESLICTLVIVSK